ncbi:MAG: beta-ketoacyl-[acyl-carrier-protein] synthase family protein [Phycisphaeraceae bacterium]|nr:MAG: beta-ketoacyl-[acyl-carrier-protein] synthase family protein [Phycisphaeraceae bacterium]
MGWTTPLGDEIDAVWERLLRADSGVGPIDRFDAGAYSTNFAAQTPDPDLEAILDDSAPHAHAGVNTRFALAAAARAWRQSGLDKRNGVNRRRIGVYLGSGEGPPDFDAFAGANLAGWDDEKRAVDMGRWVKAAYELMTAQRELEQEPNMPLSHIARAFGAGGPSYNCLTACAASTQAIGEASEIIRLGEADVMIAGGAHTMIHPLGVTGFIRLTALSSRRDDPQGACRPFSSSRDGFVMGEGAGMLIIESLAHAKARGATPLAEIVGFGSSADAFRITDIQPDGEGAQATMRAALSQAGIDPLSTDDTGRPPVHYISAHGTGTQENDSIETRGIRAVFQDNAPKIPVSSIKSMTGHLIAAAGVVEAITCVQAIRTGFVPPTRNLTQPDPQCDLDYVPNEARDLNSAGGVRVAISNSFGFGGQNNTLVMKRFED